MFNLKVVKLQFTQGFKSFVSLRYVDCCTHMTYYSSHGILVKQQLKLHMNFMEHYVFQCSMLFVN